MKTYYEENSVYADYIRSKNLGIDTIEKIVSFITDKEYCREDDFFKKEVVRFVYGERFETIWPLVIEALRTHYK